MLTTDGSQIDERVGAAEVIIHHFQNGEIRCRHMSRRHPDNGYIFAGEATTTTMSVGRYKQTIHPTSGIPQEHDSIPRRLVSVYPRQATHVLFYKNEPVESECNLNNVNPHIIRNQYQIQNIIEVTSKKDRYCKLCHYQTKTKF